MRWPVPFNNTIMLVPSHTELLIHTTLFSMTPLHLRQSMPPLTLRTPEKALLTNPSRSDSSYSAQHPPTPPNPQHSCEVLHLAAVVTVHFAFQCIRFMSMTAVSLRLTSGSPRVQKTWAPEDLGCPGTRNVFYQSGNPQSLFSRQEKDL